MAAAYRTAFTDWLACACAGARERAARAARSSGTDLMTDVAFVATAGHVLDFDDTLPDGGAHVSATVAPAALVLAGHLGLSLQTALDAYAEGYEATAAVVQGALLARGGASVDSRALHGPVGFTAVIGARWRAARTASRHRSRRSRIPARRPRSSAIGSSFTPAALGPTRRSMPPSDAAERLRGRVNGGPLDVVVHPVARQAAHLDAVSDGLSAKFSIPYCVAHTLTRGAPRTADFVQLNQGVVQRAAAVSVSLDDSLPPWGTVLKPTGADAVRLDGPRGAPGRPITEAELAGKVSDLVGDRLDGVLDDPGMPAARVLRLAGLDGGERPDRRLGVRACRPCPSVLDRGLVAAPTIPARPPWSSG